MDAIVGDAARGTDGQAVPAPHGRVRALVGVELRRIARAPGTAVGVVGFLVLLAVGHWSYWTTLPPRPEDDHLFVWAYIIAMCGMLRFGFAEDRELDLDEYLVTNLVSPLRYVLSKLLAVAAMLGVFGAGAFACAAAASAGDLQYAAWYTVLMTLVTWMSLPALLLIELAIDSRYPAIFVLMAFAATLVAGRLVFGSLVIVEALGLDIERYAYASLAPLAVRAAVAAWLLVVLYPLCRLRLVGRAGWSWAEV
jgi:hypothetical protein